MAQSDVTEQILISTGGDDYQIVPVVLRWGLGSHLARPASQTCR
jgi:hypothetical protein